MKARDRDCEPGYHGSLYLLVNDEHWYLSAILAWIEDLVSLKQGAIEAPHLNLTKHLTYGDTICANYGFMCTLWLYQYTDADVPSIMI